MPYTWQLVITVRLHCSRMATACGAASINVFCLDPVRVDVRRLAPPSVIVPADNKHAR